MISSSAPTNRMAIISFAAAFFTLASFCVGVVPIPLTAWVCYPAALLFGGVALVAGFRALNQIRSAGGKERAMALIGIWAGGLTILAVLCFTTITAVLLYYGADYLQQFWQQIQF